MKSLHIKTFVIWSALLNWPIVLCWVPVSEVKMLCFIPALFWINIPALWLGLAKLIGKPHYDIQEFGAVPKSLLAWTLIVVFWLLVAAVLTAATTFVRRRFYREREE
jgi:hypothetical protein